MRKIKSQSYLATASQVVLMVRAPLPVQETEPGSIPGLGEFPWRKALASHSSFLALENPTDGGGRQAPRVTSSQAWLNWQSMLVYIASIYQNSLLGNHSGSHAHQWLCSNSDMALSYIKLSNIIFFRTLSSDFWVIIKTSDSKYFEDENGWK